MLINNLRRLKSVRLRGRFTYIQLPGQLFRTFGENFDSMSPQVWSPGQVTWPNLQQTMRSCHCYSGGEKDVNLSWFGTPITYEFMSVLYHWPWVRSFSWPYIISQSGKLKYLQILIRSVQIVQDHTQLGYCWLPRCNFSCVNLERSFEVIWHHEVYRVSQNWWPLQSCAVTRKRGETGSWFHYWWILHTSPHRPSNAPASHTSRCPTSLPRNSTQADREFAMRVAFDVAGFILSTSSQTIAQRFSMGVRSRMLPDHTPFGLRPKVREVVLAPPLGLGARCELGLVLLKNVLRDVWPKFVRCAVRGMFSDQCIVADAAVPFSTSPRRSPTWQFCRRARYGREQYVTRAKGPSILGHLVYSLLLATFYWIEIETWGWCQNVPLI